MKKLGIIIFIAAIVVGVSIADFFSIGDSSGKVFNVEADHAVRGSGNVTSQRRNVSDFTGVDAGGLFVVDIIAQQNFEVEIYAEEDLLPLIETSVEGGVLKIRTSKDLRSESPIHVRVHAPRIDRIDASGVSRVTAANLENSSLQVDCSGVSNVQLAGTVDSLILDVSGSSKVMAAELIAKNATVDASGASSVDVFAHDQFRADVSGASRVTYGGDPAVVEQDVSGASRVSRR